jgi:hypothetical protein
LITRAITFSLTAAGYSRQIFGKPLSDMQRGRIYIMTNACIPNLVKIGKTAGSPTARANQLWSSGVPVPFSVIASVPTHDIHGTEARVFCVLRQYRWHHKREFFHLAPQEAVGIVKTLVAEAALGTPEYVMAKTLIARALITRRYARVLRQLVESLVTKRSNQAYSKRR